MDQFGFPFSPPSSMYGQQFGHQYMPLGSVPSFPPNGVFGIPYAAPIRPYTQFDFGIQNPLLGMAVNTFAAPYLDRMMTSSGLVPGSMLGGNPYHRLRDRQFQEEMSRASSALQGIEGQNLLNLYENVNVSLLGRDRAAVRQEAEGFRPIAESAASYMAVLSPQLLDQLGGPGGSPTVMLNQLAAGSRWLRDPLTGRRGFAGETLSDLSKEIYRQNYENKVQPGLKISAGQFGEVFTELAQRGMLTDPQGGFAAGDDKATRLKKMASSYTDQVGKYAETLKTVQEMFADMGRPNAPMGELFAALEAITQNTVGGQDPEKVKNNVQQLDALLRENRMTLEHLLRLQGTIGQGLRGVGLSTAHAGGISQGALAYMSAFRESGAGAPGFGRMTMEEATAHYSNRAIGAVRSREAGRAAAVLRLADSGLILDSTEEGQELKALQQALSEGQETYTFKGQTKSVFFGDTETDRINRLISKGTSVTPQAFRDFAGQLGANQRILNKNPQIVEMLTRVRQAESAQSRASATLGLSMARGFENMPGGRRLQDAEKSQFAALAATGVEAFLRTGGDVNDEAAKQLGVEAMLKQVDNIPVLKEKLQGMNQDDRRRFLSELLVQRGFETAENSMASNPQAAGAPSFAALRQFAGHSVRQNQQLAVSRAKAEAAMAAAMGGLEDPSIIRRTVRAMHDAAKDPNDPNALWTALGESLGGMSAERVMARLNQVEGGGVAQESWDDEDAAPQPGQPRRKITGTRAQRMEYELKRQVQDANKLEALEKELSNKPTDARRAAINKEIDSLNSRIGVRDKAMNAIFERAGLKKDELEAILKKRMEEMEKSLPEELQKTTLEKKQERIKEERALQDRHAKGSPDWQKKEAEIAAEEAALKQAYEKRGEALRKSDGSEVMKKRMAAEDEAARGGEKGWFDSLFGWLGGKQEKPGDAKPGGKPEGVTVRSPSAIRVEVAKIEMGKNGGATISFDGVRDVAMHENTV